MRIAPWAICKAVMQCACWLQLLLEGQGFKGVFAPLHVDVRDAALAHIRAAETESAKVRLTFDTAGA